MRPSASPSPRRLTTARSYFLSLALADMKRLGVGGMCVLRCCPLRADRSTRFTPASLVVSRAPHRMTEFGAVDNATRNIALLEWQLQGADAMLQSWAYWQFKAFADITTSGGYAESFYDATGQCVVQRLRLKSRAPIEIVVVVVFSSGCN